MQNAQFLSFSVTLSLSRRDGETESEAPHPALSVSLLVRTCVRLFLWLPVLFLCVVFEVCVARTHTIRSWFGTTLGSLGCSTLLVLVVFLSCGRMP